jgi:hypothetical protein
MLACTIYVTSQYIVISMYCDITIHCDICNTSITFLQPTTDHCNTACAVSLSLAEMDGANMVNNSFVLEAATWTYWTPHQEYRHLVS